MDQTDREDQLISSIASSVADVRTQNLTNATREVFSGTKELRRISEVYRKISPDKAQGWAFEALEVMKFNREAAKQGSSLRAVSMDSNGLHTSPYDIEIRRGLEKIREVQAKSCVKVKDTLRNLSFAEYTGMGRLLPSDQEAGARIRASRLISMGSPASDRYKDTLKNLQGRLAHGNVCSKGTTYKESFDTFLNPKLASIKHNTSALAEEANKAGLEGGTVGAGMTAGISGARGIYRLIKGEDEFGAVLAEVTVDTAKGFAASYVSSALTKGVGHVAEQAGLSGVAKCGGHAAIAAGIIQSGKSFVKYLNGEIDEEQMYEEVSHTVITGTASFYYGALGQVAIPIPLVGAVVGSTVGYFVGNILYQSGLVSLGDSAEVKQAKERRKRVEALCLQAIPLMQRHRAELQTLIEQNFIEQSQLFDSAFTDMDAAFAEWNPDACICQLEKLCNAFDTGLPFKSFEEFDKFMEDDNTTFIL